MDVAFNDTVRAIGQYLPNVLGAVLILILGWIVAMVVAALVKGVLRRTDLDDRIARSMGGDRVGTESTAGSIVFWLIMIFVLVAFFQALNLAVVSEPLNQLLTQVTAFIPRLIAAAILLLIAWILATVLRRLVTAVLGGLGIDRRLGLMVGDETAARPTATPPLPPAGSATMAETASADTVPVQTRVRPGGISLAETIGEVVYWLIFLLFLPAILSTLALTGILEPVQTLLNQVLGFVPNLFAAALILLVGWFVARIVQRIVTGLLAAVGVDRVSERAGLSGVMGGQTISGLVGLVVYVLILLPVLISALDALRIQAISQPATNMLNTILLAIPNIFAAAVLLLIAYVVGRLVAGLIANLLAGLGFNSLPARLGLGSGTTTVGERTPAEIVGILIMTAIMLFSTIEAVRLLGFGAAADLLAELTTLFGRIVLGLIIFGIGVYFANLAYRLVRESDLAQGELLPRAAQISILALTGAMALQQMGLANEIVNLAFGLVLGAIAVAVALAFGLGGRDIAARELQGWVQSAKSQIATPDDSPPALPPPRDPTV